MNVEHQLYEYILGMLQQGYQLTAIHEQLQQQGYDAATLKHVFNAISDHKDPADVQTTTHKPNGMIVAVLFAIILIGGVITVFALLNVDESAAFAEEQERQNDAVREQRARLDADEARVDETTVVSTPTASRSTGPIPVAGTTANTNGATAEFAGESTIETPVVEITPEPVSVETGTIEEFCRDVEDLTGCITAFASARSDNTLCLIHETTEGRDKCYRQFILNGNSDLCDQVETQTVLDDCALLA